jgi:hypothetical protein
MDHKDPLILCVVDKSEELTIAVRYACRMAVSRKGGQVGLLYTLEPSDMQNWLAVESIMKQENRAEAEAILQRWAMMVEGLTGQRPITYVREGKARDQIFTLLQEEPDITHIVLASAGDGEAGPLVSALTGKGRGKVTIPITIVPGILSSEEIDALF